MPAVETPAQYLEVDHTSEDDKHDGEGDVGHDETVDHHEYNCEQH